MHMSGSGMGIHQYAAEGTSVTLQVETWKERGEWQTARYYVYQGKLYEHYGEAVGAEKLMQTQFKLHEVSGTNP